MQGILDALQTNAVLVGLVVGSVTPLLISVVQQPTLSTNARKVLATAISVVVGVVVAGSTGQLDINSITDATQVVGVIGAVWAAAETFFQKLWQPAGVTATLEQVTSPWARPEADVEWGEDGPEGFETK